MGELVQSNGSVIGLELISPLSDFSVKTAIKHAPHLIEKNILKFFGEYFYPMELILVLSIVQFITLKWGVFSDEIPVCGVQYVGLSNPSSNSFKNTVAFLN
jgi:hypothetical protein